MDEGETVTITLQGDTQTPPRFAVYTEVYAPVTRKGRQGEFDRSSASDYFTRHGEKGQDAGSGTDRPMQRRAG